MTRILRWFPAIAASTIGCFLAASYVHCISRSCSNSRFDLVLLYALALGALVASVSIVMWHRWTPAVLMVVIPCPAGIYLFEALGSSPAERYNARLIEAIRADRARGIDAVPQWTPYGFAAGKGVLRLGDGSEVVPL